MDMTETHFIKWLEGFLENTGNDGLNQSRLNAIKNKLAEVKTNKEKNKSTMVDGGKNIILSC